MPSSDGSLEFGVVLWTFGDQADSAYFETVTERAAERGYDITVLGDHVVFPARHTMDYPAGPSPPEHFRASQTAYETFEVLPYLAAKTEGIRLGTNVCVVPYRHPVTLLKQLLSLYSLSDGRFELGAGVGWLEQEFEVLDVEFEDRGVITDDFLELFQTVRSNPETAFDGRRISFPETGFHPVPEGIDEMPIWIGGHSSAAFRRIAQFGDGWTSMGARPDEVVEARERIDAAWSDFDRDGEPRLAVTRAVEIGDDPDQDPGRPLVGSPDAVREDVREYERAGVDRIIVDFFEPDLDDQLTQLDRFADEVLPAFS